VLGFFWGSSGVVGPSWLRQAAGSALEIDLSEVSGKIYALLPCQDSRSLDRDLVGCKIVVDINV
jgi:hypothetical protein